MLFPTYFSRRKPVLMIRKADMNGSAEIRLIQWSKPHVSVPRFSSKGRNVNIFTHGKFALTALTTRAVAVSLIVIAVIVLYVGMSQLTGAPHYTAHYDDVVLPTGAKAAASKVAAVTAAMIRDGVDRGWCPSESFLTPAGWRTDTCAFQLGQEKILSRTTFTLREDVATLGSLNDIDKDLDIAVERIQAGPRMWGVIYSTVSNYGIAADALDRFNARLVNGDAGYYPRIDNLGELLKTIIRATGGQVEVLKAIDSRSWIMTGQTRAEFVRTRGEFAAACEILKAVQVDFASVIDKQSVKPSMDAAVDAVCAVNETSTPMFSWYLDSHIASLSGNGATAVAKLQNVYSHLASMPGNSGR